MAVIVRERGHFRQGRSSIAAHRCWFVTRKLHHSQEYTSLHDCPRTKPSLTHEGEQVCTARSRGHQRSTAAATHLQRGHLTMRHSSAHVFALRETHVRDASCFHIELAAVVPVAVALLVCCWRDTTAVLLVLGTKEQGCSKVVRASTEQIYIMDTMEVDRLREQWYTGNGTDKAASMVGVGR